MGFLVQSPSTLTHTLVASSGRRGLTKPCDCQGWERCDLLLPWFRGATVVDLQAGVPIRRRPCTDGASSTIDGPPRRFLAVVAGLGLQLCADVYRRWGCSLGVWRKTVEMDPRAQSILDASLTAKACFDLGRNHPRPCLWASLPHWRRRGAIIGPCVILHFEVRSPIFRCVLRG